MDIAALGLSVDSGPLSRAVQELRQVPAAARSAAAGADQVVGAAERMARAMMQSTTAANENVRALQVVGSASRTAMQQMANSFAGVRDFDTGSLIAYGRELDGIRAKYNPLFAAGRQYRETLQDINVALKLGAISEKERAEAIARTKAEFVGQVAGINTASAALRGNANALRAVAIQIPDVIQGIAMGQSGFQLFTQQGLQTVQVLGMQPGGIGGAFKELGKWASAFITPARLAAGGILAIGTAALTAAAQYQSAQRQMSTSLLGSGRASGATVGDLNQAASAGASTFGLSISEAREFAATLAQTGKIGVDEIGKIIKVGHDVATVYGVDATEAAGLLAQSFADPVRGAEKLNERLGFLSARMQSDIASLVAQNRLYDAQKILLSGVASGVDGASASLGGMAKGWTAVGNAISNAWNSLGEWTARALNMAPPETGQRIKEINSELADLTQSIAVWEAAKQKGYESNALDEALVKQKLLREELERLVAQQDKYKKSVEDTQRSAQSRMLAGTASRYIPEAQQLKDLNDQYTALKTALDKANASGGESAKIFSDLPFSYSQLATAVERAKGAVEGFKSEYEKTIASLKLDISAVGAKGPAALGNIAYQRSLLQSGSNSSEAVAKAELDRTLAIKQAQQQILDTQNARLLSSRQATETAQMELSVLGKSVAEQEVMRGKLAARQQLEQEALQTYGNRDAYDRAHLASLEKEVEKQAAIKQLLAEQQLKRDVKFQTDTLFMSSGDQQIASTLRNVYGDDWKSQMDGALAQQMRINNALVEAKNAAADFTASMIEGFARGEDMTKTLESALNSLSSSLIRMGSQQVIGGLLQALSGGGQQAGGGLIGGLLQSLGGLGGGAVASGSGYNDTGGVTGGGLGGILSGAGGLLSLIPGIGTIAGGALAIGGGLLTSFFGQNQQKKQAQQQAQQQLLQQQQQAAQEAARVAQQQADTAANYRYQARSLGIDTSSYAGAMAKLELDIQHERAEAAKVGGAAITAYEQLAQAKRYALEKEWAEKIAQVKLSYEDRVFAATNDNATLAGKLAEYDRKAAQERVDAIKIYGQVYVELEQAQAAERGKIIKDALKEQTDYYDGLRKTISDFTSGLQFGNLSTLSPAEQYLAARNQFQTQYGLAIGGDRTAQGGITGVAQTLLEQARNYLGPSVEYGSLVDRITQQLGALPDLAMAADPQVQELQRIGDSGMQTVDQLTAISQQLQQTQAENRALQQQVAALIADGNRQSTRVAELTDKLRLELRQGLESIKIRAA